MYPPANGMLTIRGKKRTERDEHNKDKNWHVVERSLWLVQPSNPPAIRSLPRESRGEV